MADTRYSLAAGLTRVVLTKPEPRKVELTEKIDRVVLNRFLGIPISGVCFVLVFVPVIFTMMFFITFMECSGYMARAAFVMDRAMYVIGLNVKSFIPMILSFGCNVPWGWEVEE